MNENEQTVLLLNEAMIKKALECIKDAKSEILVCAYVWNWYTNAPERDIQKFNYELVRKVANGVTCKAITYKLCDIGKLETLGIKCKTLKDNRIMHAKAICVDGKIIVLGSHNLTYASTSASLEASLVTDSQSVILSFKDYFDRMWAAL